VYQTPVTIGEIDRQTAIGGQGTERKSLPLIEHQDQVSGGYRPSSIDIL